MLQIRCAILIGLFLAGISLFSAETKITLPAPQALQSMETPVHSVQAILPQGDRLWFLAGGVSLLLNSSYHRAAMERTKRFGSLLEAKKFALGTSTDLATWVDIGLYHQTLLLLDGQGLHLHTYSQEGVEVSKQSLIWDLVLPARDAVGEAATWEIQQLRKNLQVQMEKTMGKKLTGMAAVPASWKKSQKSLWWVSSKLSGFPLFWMACNPSAPTRCELARMCPLPSNLAAFEPGGIGVDEKRQNLLLVDRTHNALQVIRYRTCHDLTWQKTLYFPKFIRGVTNAKMEANGTLWITLAEADPYTNGGIFFYTPAELAPFLD